MKKENKLRYFGGKVRIANDLSQFLNKSLKDNQPFIDLFCGSCNVVSKIDGNRIVVANDLNKYLIAMWKALQEGWIPPKNLTEKEYQYIKRNKEEDPALTSFVGFGCSFAGKFFGGYARGDGDRNYCLNAYNQTMKKAEKLKEVIFYNADYRNVPLPQNSLIYCDIPYKDTTGYSVGSFDHDSFYEWAKSCTREGHKVLVSEYKQNVPDDAIIAYEVSSKKDIRNKSGIKEETTEVLFTYQ